MANGSELLIREVWGRYMHLFASTLRKSLNETFSPRMFIHKSLLSRKNIKIQKYLLALKNLEEGL